jgi:hypothetical protein
MKYMWFLSKNTDGASRQRKGHSCADAMYKFVKISRQTLIHLSSLLVGGQPRGECWFRHHRIYDGVRNVSHLHDACSDVRPTKALSSMEPGERDEQHDVGRKKTWVHGSRVVCGR